MLSPHMCYLRIWPLEPSLRGWSSSRLTAILAPISEAEFLSTRYSQCRLPFKIRIHCRSRQNQWSLDERAENIQIQSALMREGVVRTTLHCIVTRYLKQDIHKSNISHETLHQSINAHVHGHLEANIPMKNRMF